MSSALPLSAYGLPIVYTLFLWWLSTGLILYLDGLPRRTYRWSLGGATVLLVVAFVGLAATRSQATVAGAYLAFSFAVLVWGWLEMSFLMGFVTGPRKEACPEGCRGARHFLHAVETLLYHELAIVAGATSIWLLDGGAANPVGLWTFVVLWWMRVSTKLNVFLGVPNLTEEFLPDHLRYLTRYFTKRPMNLLFPVSVTASTAVTTLLVRGALDPAASAFETTGRVLLATLMALAVIEHWFLVVPLPAASLWSWGLRSRESREGQASSGAPTRSSAPSSGSTRRAS